MPRSLRVVILVFYLIGGLTLGVVAIAGLGLRFEERMSDWWWVHVDGGRLLFDSCTLWAPSGIMLVGNKDVSRLRLGLLGTTGVLSCAATAIIGHLCLMTSEVRLERFGGSVKTASDLVVWASVVLLVALPIGHKAAF